MANGNHLNRIVDSITGPAIDTCCPFRFAAYIANAVINDVFVQPLGDVGTIRESSVVTCLVGATAREKPSNHCT